MGVREAEWARRRIGPPGLVAGAEAARSALQRAAPPVRRARRHSSRSSPSLRGARSAVLEWKDDAWAQLDGDLGAHSSMPKNTARPARSRESRASARPTNANIIRNPFRACHSSEALGVGALSTQLRAADNAGAEQLRPWSLRLSGRELHDRFFVSAIARLAPHPARFVSTGASHASALSALASRRLDGGAPCWAGRPKLRIRANESTRRRTASSTAGGGGRPRKRVAFSNPKRGSFCT